MLFENLLLNNVVLYDSTSCSLFMLLLLHIIIVHIMIFNLQYCNIMHKYIFSTVYPKSIANKPGIYKVLTCFWKNHFIDTFEELIQVVIHLYVSKFGYKPTGFSIIVKY